MKKSRIWFVLILILIISFILGLIFGGVQISLKDVIKGLFSTNDKYSIIMKNIRLPRVLGCMVAGIGLSIAGVLLQNVTNNSLASPNIIGVNSGAGLFVICLLSFIPNIFYALPVVAFFGAFVTTLLIIAISNKIGSSKITILLSGMIITTLLNAIISLISLLNTDALISYNYFSIGGLNGLSYEKLVIPLIFVVIALFFSVIFSKDIEVLALGNEMAISLGVNVKRIRMIALILSSIAASAVVSFAGLLGFVGLIVPHMARKIVGNNTRKSLFASALIGSSLVILADLIGRVIIAPSEIPVGIIMALIGAPFFLVLLLNGGRYARN